MATRCNAWSYPGHASWDGLLKNTPDGRQCALDRDHAGAHELSGPWTAISHPPQPEQVDHPSHYGGESNPYETIKVIAAWRLGFLLGNAVKYISRAGKKDPGKLIEDLEKARWYLDEAIKRAKLGERPF